MEAGGRKSLGIRPPVRLGSTPAKARKIFINNADLRGTAVDWIDWFDANWFNLFKSDGREAGILAAMDEAKAILKKLDRDSSDYGLWMEVIGVLEAWD